MKDYSEMSDFEINKAVALLTGIKERDINEASRLIHRRFQLPNMRFYAFFEPCSNPADAWPIIAENRINVEWHEMKNDTFKAYALSNETMIGYYDNSALRAAMTVFLMMKDRESSHADA